MPLIRIQTMIAAPIERVFDLSRSVDLHTLSTAHTNEQAVAGKTSGLLGMDDWVTWRARHLGFTQALTSRITSYERPFSFVDEMQQGAFKDFSHLHLFEAQDEVNTLMTDVFDYTSPMGVLGRMADVLFLTRYMRRLLEKRNAMIKEFAEGGRWQEVLPAK